MAEDGRTCVCEFFFGQGKLFSFPIYVTSKTFVSQTGKDEKERKMRRHSHHNLERSRSSDAPRRNIFFLSSWQWFWHWNKRKSEFSVCDPQTLARTYTHVVSIERFTNIGKKYEIIKILDVWYWFLLIFHYETEKREGKWCGRADGAECFQFFASAYIFPSFFLRYKNWEGRWSGKIFQLFSVRNMNAQWQTYHQHESRAEIKEKFIKT